MEESTKPIQFMFHPLNKKYIRWITVGIIIMIIGLILVNSVKGFLGSGSTYPYNVDLDIKRIATAFVIIYYIGLAILLIGLMYLAIFGVDIETNLRIGLLIAFGMTIWGGLNTGSLSLSSIYW